MARYIDADELIKKIFPYDVVDKKEYAINAYAVYDAIQKTPSAEVAPKSEMLEEVLEMVRNVYCYQYQPSYDDVKESVKRQMARKIRQS